MKYVLKGLYLITDNELIPQNRFFDIIESVLASGARVLQLRDKTSPSHEVVKRGKKLLEITRKYGVPLIINDSPDIAKEVGADGVHLGENDPSVFFARAILGRDAIIGVSCYNRLKRGLEAEKQGADYVVFGTPYYTPTKPNREPTSLDTLREAKRLIKSIPVFAIGGINSKNASQIISTGVDGIAVITGVFGVENPALEARKLSEFFK